MTAPRGDDPLSVPIRLPSTPIIHTLLANGFESVAGSRLDKIIEETTDQSIIVQNLTAGGSMSSSNPTGTTFTSDSFISGMDSVSIGMPATLTTTAGVFITSPAYFNLSSTTYASVISASSSSTLSRPVISTTNPVSPPPASAYTTGLYIALGLIVLFGALCALVTSPVVATAVKSFFRTRPQPEQ